MLHSATAEDNVYHKDKQHWNDIYRDWGVQFFLQHSQCLDYTVPNVRGDE
jgi:hypothetical protein